MMCWDGRCLLSCSGPQEAQPGLGGSPSSFFQQLQVPKAGWERTCLHILPLHSPLVELLFQSRTAPPPQQARQTPSMRLFMGSSLACELRK